MIIELGSISELTQNIGLADNIDASHYDFHG